MAISFSVTRLDNGQSEVIQTTSVDDVDKVPKNDGPPYVPESAVINFRGTRGPLPVTQTQAQVQALMDA